MPIIEMENRKKNPEKPGTIIFDSQRNAKDIFIELKNHLKSDGRLPDDYFIFDADKWGKGTLFPRDAEVLCNVNFGGSEGVYIDIFVKYQKEVAEYNEAAQTTEKKPRMVTEHFATGKTLGDDIADLDKMFLVGSSVIAGFYGDKSEVCERYDRIANGEESRVYPERDDRDNNWERELNNDIDYGDDESEF